jgi:hypothetical protein
VRCQPSPSRAAVSTLERVRLSGAIMTHPARLAHAHALRDRHPELDLRVVVDPAPEQGPCAMRTARLAWQAADPTATHHLLLQDDAVPCASFAAELRRAIEARPTAVVSLHSEWGCGTSYAVRLAALAGSPWADVVDDYVPTLGVVLPTRLAAEFGRFTGYDGPHDDVALRRYLATVGIDAHVTVPNLVDDAPLPSVAGHDYRGADHAACWRREVGDIDWTVPVATPRALPMLSWQTVHFGWRVPPDEPGRIWPLGAVKEVLQGFGLHESNVGSLARASVRRWSAAMPDVDAGALHGLWLTGFGLGVALADLTASSMEPVDDALARPAAGLALGTMPGGALRFTLDRGRVVELGDELRRLVEHGVRHGHRALRNVQRTRR